PRAEHRGGRGHGDRLNDHVVDGPRLVALVLQAAAVERDLRGRAARDELQDDAAIDRVAVDVAVAESELADLVGVAEGLVGGAGRVVEELAERERAVHLDVEAVLAPLRAAAVPGGEEGDRKSVVEEK